MTIVKENKHKKGGIIWQLKLLKREILVWQHAEIVGANLHLKEKM
jgi:hypothetical protein